MATQLSSARFAICVYASFVVALFAYRFGVFRLAAEHAVRPASIWFGFDLVLLGFGLVWFGLLFLLLLLPVFRRLPKSICIQRIHLASFYLQHKQLHNCCVLAMEFEFIGQAGI